MIKDKLLHEKLGIPQQTLQNWKNSDTYTSLLYNYLINQDKEKFESDADKVAAFYNYTLLTPTEFSILVEKHWQKFDIFKGYKVPETITMQKGDEEQSLTYSYNDNKSVILVRYVYAMSKQKEAFFDEVERVADKVKSLPNDIESFKIIYITSTQLTPKYFSELKHNVTMVNYAALFRIFSDDKIIII